MVLDDAPISVAGAVYDSDRHQEGGRHGEFSLGCVSLGHADIIDQV